MSELYQSLYMILFWMWVVKKALFQKHGERNKKSKVISWNLTWII